MRPSLVQTRPDAHPPSSISIGARARRRNDGHQQGGATTSASLRPQTAPSSAAGRSQAAPCSSLVIKDPAASIAMVTTSSEAVTGGVLRNETRPAAAPSWAKNLPGAAKNSEKKHWNAAVQKIHQRKAFSHHEPDIAQRVQNFRADKISKASDVREVKGLCGTELPEVVKAIRARNAIKKSAGGFGSVLAISQAHVTANKALSKSLHRMNKPTFHSRSQSATPMTYQAPILDDPQSRTARHRLHVVLRRFQGFNPEFVGANLEEAKASIFKMGEKKGLAEPTAQPHHLLNELTKEIVSKLNEDAIRRLETEFEQASSRSHKVAGLSCSEFVKCICKLLIPQSMAALRAQTVSTSLARPQATLTSNDSKRDVDDAVRHATQARSLFAEIDKFGRGSIS